MVMRKYKQIRAISVTGQREVEKLWLKLIKKTQKICIFFAMQFVKHENKLFCKVNAAICLRNRTALF